jgi:hypothetical protein
MISKHAEFNNYKYTMEKQNYPEFIDHTLQLMVAIFKFIIKVFFIYIIFIFKDVIENLVENVII